MGRKAEQEARRVEQDEAALSPAETRRIEQTGAIEVAARLGSPVPARVGNQDRDVVKWVCRLLAIGYGFKTPAMVALDILEGATKLNEAGDQVAAEIDRAEKRLRSLAAMILADTLNWPHDRTAEAFGTTQAKVQKWARRGRKWAEHPKAASAVHHIAGYVVSRLDEAHKPKRGQRAKTSTVKRAADAPTATN